MYGYEIAQLCIQPWIFCISTEFLLPHHFQAVRCCKKPHKLVIFVCLVVSSCLLKFIISEKATNVCKILTLLLNACTVVKILWPFQNVLTLLSHWNRSTVRTLQFHNCGNVSKKCTYIQSSVDCSMHQGQQNFCYSSLNQRASTNFFFTSTFFMTFTTYQSIYLVDLVDCYKMCYTKKRT